MSSRTLNLALTIILVFGMAGVTYLESQGNPAYSSEAFYRSSLAGEGKQRGGSVASAHPLATQAGMEILSRGGNAVDAAIAVAYALGVVEPHGSGIGGGGTMLIYPGGERKPAVYDYREEAPRNGRPSTLGIGVPGFVKGMEAVHQDYGTLDMKELIEPSIRLAEEGYQISSIDESRIENAAYRMPVDELPHFYPEGAGLKKGDILKQTELARTLEQIQQGGSDVFYRGSIAREMVRKTEALTMQDLARYQVEKKQPIKGEFAGYEVLAPPAPSGGIMMIQMLQMMERLKIEETKDNPADFIHLTGEIYKRSYRDRLHKIGDPNFVQVPQAELISRAHTDQLASSIDKKKLSPEYRFELDSRADEEDHDNTTHFVVVDKDGMMVSATNTVSNFFGSGVYVKGFFLNNQLKNFSITSKFPNRWAPGKKPYSYTTPMILVKPGESIIGIGSAGGRRIPAMVGQALARHLKFGEPLKEAIRSPRSYVEIQNDTVAMEKEFPPSVRNELMKRGYPATSTPSSLYFGNIHTIKLDLKNGRLEGAADPRRDGTWRVEH
ncbi:gamma-glutamyltransferase 1 [Melghirimyces profundicolus]|uniref:Glutathione hydrolase proenzyme n=1 Tax=Melghirimyces profundicolus TaxID=1242148 RepID=A0A2T6BTK6_9BACL|nr:gamma-glutamyltransferase [Melghirimyces profundicolus]PTX59411.1 gamma-glutamyltransferase 1 [Melghirimyces profundicolus]